MPGKYSTGMVMAQYSNRGMIDLPNDQYLDHARDYIRQETQRQPARDIQRAQSSQSYYSHSNAANGFSRNYSEVNRSNVSLTDSFSSNRNRLFIHTESDEEEPVTSNIYSRDQVTNRYSRTLHPVRSSPAVGVSYPAGRPTHRQHSALFENRHGSLRVPSSQPNLRKVETYEKINVSTFKLQMPDGKNRSSPSAINRQTPQDQRDYTSAPSRADRYYRERQPDVSSSSTQQLSPSTSKGSGRSTPSLWKRLSSTVSKFDGQTSPFSAMGTPRRQKGVRTQSDEHESTRHTQPLHSPNTLFRSGAQELPPTSPNNEPTFDGFSDDDENATGYFPRMPTPSNLNLERSRSVQSTAIDPVSRQSSSPTVKRSTMVQSQAKPVQRLPSNTFRSPTPQRKASITENTGLSYTPNVLVLSAMTDNDTERNTPSSATVGTTVDSHARADSLKSMSGVGSWGVSTIIRDSKAREYTVKEVENTTNEDWHLPEIAEDNGYVHSIFEDGFLDNHEGERGLHLAMSNIGHISSGRDVNFEVDDDAASILSAALPPDIGRYRNEQDEFALNYPQVVHKQAVTPDNGRSLPVARVRTKGLGFFSKMKTIR